MNEIREAKMDGATPIKNSGRGMMKGDAVLGRFLLDYKDYTNSFSISLSNLHKHARDAWKSDRKVPAQVVTINPKAGSSDRAMKVAVIPWNVFQGLLETERKYEELCK